MKVTELYPGGSNTADTPPTYFCYVVRVDGMYAQITHEYRTRKIHLRHGLDKTNMYKQPGEAKDVADLAKEEGRVSIVIYGLVQVQI